MGECGYNPPRCCGIVPTFTNGQDGNRMMGTLVSRVRVCAEVPSCYSEFLVKRQQAAGRDCGSVISTGIGRDQRDGFCYSRTSRQGWSRQVQYARGVNCNIGQYQPAFRFMKPD